MEKNIRILDCTLRDGGHLNQGEFGEEVIKSTIQRLVDAKIDIIEVGFLWDKIYNTDVARYYSIEDVKRILPKDKGNSKFSLMADFIDLESLEPCDGTIEYIRLSFKRHRLEWGLKTAKILMDKGYKCFINPVNCNVYTDEDYIEVLKKVNDLHPYGFSIVDTFGVLRKRDLTRIYNLVENILEKDITIGLHLHENLGLAYSLAQHFIEIHQPKRNIVIDGSLLGMGREPGNLCIEQILDHLKVEYDMPYNTEPALDAIDDYIAPIKEKKPWGYSIPYMLSAKYCLHRTYAEYLMNKKRLKTKDIQRILSLVDTTESEMFNEEYIEGIYKNYMDVNIDSKKTMEEISDIINSKSNILIIAPGQSLKTKKEEVLNYIEENKPIVVSINFLPKFCEVDLVFCTNNRRLDMMEIKNNEQLIITSNIMSDAEQVNKVISFNSVVYHNENYCDDSTLMMLNVIDKINYKGGISLAGFDGFVNDKVNFCNELFEQTHTTLNSNRYISEIIKKCYGNLKLKFITSSEHEKYLLDN